MKKTGINKKKLHNRVIDTVSISEIRDLLGDMPRDRSLLIEYLHKIQDNYRQISKRHITALANELKLSKTDVYEVATFYHHFDVVDDSHTPPEITVRVCESMTCEMFGSRELIEQLNTATDASIKIQAVPCVGRCHAAPVAVVGTNPVENATPAAVQNMIKEGKTSSARADYINYEEYCAKGGYETLKKCLAGEYSVESVISTLEDAGLRGLGGAGFPVGQKWKILRQQAKPRLIAINIDEGEPGTFKDRHYLETDPHRFLEGTLIAHWAIEAEDIYIYLRDEYAECRKILENELLLLNKQANFMLPRIHLRRGAGAYICGEESAMIESIEGKRGMPRLRPPYVAEVGLFGRPTLEQNMESMHWVRDLIEQGTAWFTAEGRNNRKGLRSFSVSGRVKNPGVHLAPAGITVRDLIDEYCEGMLDGHKFYGYFPGGASGGILPASLDNIPLDFDSLQPYGTFIGSAAVIIFSEQDSAKALALNAMRFFRDESCGQCTPCRVGTAKAVSLMEKPDWDTELLDDLAIAMEDTSICGLGQAAPNPLRCAVKYFPDEF